MKNSYLLAYLLLVGITLKAQNYTILGNASSLSGCNCFRLTPDAEDMAGAIFQNNTINLNNSFDYKFNVFLGCNGAGGADGICFALTSNPNGLGNQGEGLGYAGSNQPYSLAVEYDTWQNGSPANDPSFDHIGVNSGGLYSHNVAPPVPALSSQSNIDDCQWHTTRIVWDVNTNTLSVYFDGVLRQTVVIPNIVNTYFGGNPIVNWGWTGATGGGTNDQQVCVVSNSNWVGGINYQSCNTTVQFTDISTSNIGSVQSWAWDFGDGTTSTQQNPVHTYASTGTYTTSLTITDNAGCTNTYAHDITINPPIAITPTLVPPPCNGGTNGNIIVSASGGFGVSAGYGGYSFEWNDGTKGANDIGLTAGTYTVTATDGVCTTTAQYTLNQAPPLTATITHTDASCGANNGTVGITLSGGTQPYTPVTWTGGFVGTAVTGLAPGLYIADFHDANGCSALLQYKTTVGSLPCGYTLNTSSSDVSCYGGSDGSATVTVTGGVAPITITWSNGGTGATISGLPAGNYSYDYTDGGTGHFTGTITVNQPAAPMAASLTTVNLSCAGTNDGQALASVVSGGVSPYNYTWSGGQPNNAVASNLSAGAVTVTVTDVRGCTATATATVAAPPALAVTTTSIDDSCYHAHLGSATANVSGGNAPYTFYWSNISSAQTNLSLGAGTYTVTVTDDEGCTATGTATLSEPPAFSYTLVSQNIKCYGDSTGSITISPAGGISPYSYTWGVSGISGNSPVNLKAGLYRVTIADSHGCGNADSVLLTQPAAALSALSSHTDVSCYNADNGVLTLTVSGGTPPYSYQSNPLPQGTTTLTNLPPGTYAGMVTDSNACSVAVSETIVQPAPQSLTVTATDNLCSGATAGTASANFANPTGSVTYDWSNGQTGAALSSLAAGTYVVTATDQNGCSLTDSATVNEPAAPLMSVSVADALCFGANGTATANPSGGTAPFSYTWSGSSMVTAVATVPAGSYTVTATDANSCNQTASFVINEPPALVLAETHTDVLCHGGTDGSASITVSGGTPGYAYTWSMSADTSNAITALSAGSYTVTVTDTHSCTASQTITLSEPSALTLTLSSTPELCPGESVGTITANTTGGVAPYTFSTTDGTNPLNSSTGTFSSLAAGNYTVTVSDQHACEATATVTVLQPDSMQSNFTTTDVSCYRYSDGQIAVAVLGGVSPFTFALSNGSTNTSGLFSGLAAGTYQVTITDANGCSVSGAVALAEPDSVMLQVTPATTEVDLGNSLPIQLNTNQTGAITYTWMPPSGLTCYDCPNPTFTGIYSQKYQVTATTAQGCTGVAHLEVIVHPNYDLFVPNAFTPNGDGANDVWKIFGNMNGLKQIEVAVFNRSGEKVFESDNIYFQWDGTYRGTQVPPGVYVYYLKSVWVDNHADNHYRGSITILR